MRSVTDLSPAHLLGESGLDPNTVIGDLARSTGSKREIRVPSLGEISPATSKPARWPLGVVMGAVLVFLLWWFGLR